MTLDKTGQEMGRVNGFAGALLLVVAQLSAMAVERLSTAVGGFPV